MHFDHLYLDLHPKYAVRFERKGLDFDKYYGHAYNNYQFQATDNDIKTQVIKSLEAVLAAYSTSEPKTKGGGVLRKIGRMVMFVLPFLKYLKVGK